MYGALVLLALIMLGLAAGELYRMLQKWRRLGGADALGRVEVEGAKTHLRRGDPQHPLIFAPGPLVKVFRRRVGEALVLALGGAALLTFALSRLPGA